MVSNPQTVYAQVVDSNTGCESSGFAEVELLVENASNSNGISIDLMTRFKYIVCSYGGFDLNDPQLVPITAGVSPPFTLNFYDNEDDALLQVNPIDSNIIYESPADIIYARVENASGFCVGISEINLVVNPLPELYDDIIVDDPYLICNDGIDEIKLFALNELQDPLFVYTYTWFDGSGTVVGNSDSLITKSLKNMRPLLKNFIQEQVPLVCQLELFL